MGFGGLYPAPESRVQVGKDAYADGIVEEPSNLINFLWATRANDYCEIAEGYGQDGPMQEEIVPRLAEYKVGVIKHWS